MGLLYVVATPVGNLEDITLRAIKILLSTRVIVCEDTRRTGQMVKILAEKYGQIVNLGEIFHKYISVRDWNEAAQVDTVLRELENENVAIVSDAGTPLLSDPGFKVVRAAREAGIRVIPIPGAFAGATAVSAAGLPTNKIMFWGFLPKKWDLMPGMTHVIYESPTRTDKTIEEIKNRYPEAKIILGRELTKIHEYIGPDDHLTKKGEVVILVYLENIAG
jgi:16S rRNA (cytidine1402-2'-O)-methyltransferase